MFSGEVDFGVHNTHVSREGVIAGKSLFLNAERTADLLFPGIVDGILVPGEVIGTREDRIAWLAGCGIDPLTFVRARLGVAFEELR